MVIKATNPLHLYRSLLRECTYLPDSQARAYMYKHVVSSFRRHLPRAAKDPREELPLPRQISLLYRGRHTLSVLRRANQGYLRPLQNILFLTYGRKGRRRRELLAELVQPDIPADRNAVEALAANGGDKVEKYSRKWEPSSRIMALLRSQNQQADILDRSATLASKLKVLPAIPEKNTWGRPMPESRVRNLMREWYAKQLSRLLPPLPEHEYQRLQNLIDGKLGPMDGARPRRKPNLSTGDSTKPQDTLLNERLALEGPPKSCTFGIYIHGRPHQLKPRFMRRVWASVYKHVPQMTWNQGKQKWMVVWDVHATSHARVISASDDSLRMLFGNDT